MKFLLGVRAIKRMTKSRWILITIRCGVFHVALSLKYHFSYIKATHQLFFLSFYLPVTVMNLAQVMQ